MQKLEKSFFFLIDSSHFLEPFLPPTPIRIILTLSIKNSVKLEEKSHEKNAEFLGEAAEKFNLKLTSHFGHETQCVKLVKTESF